MDNLPSVQPRFAAPASDPAVGDRVSLQHGYAGVAETGTLVLPGGPQRPTTLNLLSETEMVMLRTSRVVGAYEEVWDLVRAELAASAGGIGAAPASVGSIPVAAAPAPGPKSPVSASPTVGP